MWKCPVCDKENTAATVCPTCGFDGSCDYEHYPAPCGGNGSRSRARGWISCCGTGLSKRRNSRAIPRPQRHASAGWRIPATGRHSCG